MRATFIVVITLCGLLAFSCKKDSDDAAFELANTTWTDSINLNGYTYRPYTIKFLEDGFLTVQVGPEGGIPEAHGRWTKEANSSIVSISYDEDGSNTVGATSWEGQGTLNSTNTAIENGTLTDVKYGYTATFHAIKQ
jgi:hypothetical protein